MTYLFLVAVVNMAIGFALSWQLGRRYRPAMALAALNAGGGPAEVPAATSSDPAPASASATVAAAAPPADTPPPSLSESLLERLDSAVIVYQEELQSIDSEIRLCLEKPEVEPIKACLESLSESNQKYLGTQHKIQAGLVALGKEDPAVGELQSQFSVLEGEIDAVGQFVGSFDYSGDLTAGCRELLHGTERLREKGREVGNAVESAEAKLLPHPVAELPRDALTGLLAWDAFLAGIPAQWTPDRPPLSLALLSLDAFPELTERLGNRCCDRILQNVAQWLTSECRDDCRLARCVDESGFAFMLPGRKLAEATNQVERLRQTLEHTRFVYLESEVQLTVSGGIVQASPDDTPETLLERSTTALREAQRYGRNRCFQYEGNHPTPVAPPTFAIEPKQVLL